MSCLKALAMFRFVLPKADLRVAGGREVILGTLQPLALFAANSFFTNGYLTTPGAEPSADWRMIEEAGFEAEVLPG
jgi:biotin synthase